MDLKELLNDHQMYHSQFQQDYFITARAGGTKYGMYKQALRELYKRYRGLKGLYADKALLQVDIDELDASENENVFEERRNEINKAKKIMYMEEIDKNIFDTEREFERFYKQAATLKNSLGNIDENKRNKYDIDMWKYKLKEMAALDYISNGRLSKATIELVFTLPFAMRTQTLAIIKNSKTLLDWYERRTTTVRIDDSSIDVKKLLKE